MKHETVLPSPVHSTAATYIKYLRAWTAALFLVSGIPPAEAGGWPSSTRLVSKIKPNEDG